MLLFIILLKYIYFLFSLQEARLHLQSLSGDALILAAIVSYLGPFGPDMRTELLSKWKNLCKTGQFNIKPKDPRTTLFTQPDTSSYPLLGFPIPVSEKLQIPYGQALGMSQDTTSERMVVKLLLWGCSGAWVQFWPLLVDTHQHLDIISQRWIITGRTFEWRFAGSYMTEFVMTLTFYPIKSVMKVNSFIFGTPLICEYLTK